MRWLILSFVFLTGCTAPLQKVDAPPQATRILIKDSVAIFHRANVARLDSRIYHLEQFQVRPVKVLKDKVVKGKDGKITVFLHWTKNPTVGLREASRSAIAAFVTRDRKIRDLQVLIDQEEWLEAMKLHVQLSDLFVK